MRGVLVVAALSLQGCCFGRSYDPADHYLLVTVKTQPTPRADASLPNEVCKDVCGPYLASDEKLVGCWVASIASGPKPPKRFLLWEYSQDDASWLNNGMQLPDDFDAHANDPNNLEPAICAAHHRTSEHVHVRNCHLSPAPPEPPAIGTTVVECKKRRPGGCDMNLSRGSSCWSLM